MPYYSTPADAVDDFDEFDPTPYGGGYDLVLTYGRPLPPSRLTCYPSSSSASGDFDYTRPKYSSHAQPSAYADDALQTEYSSYARPKPRPGPAYGFTPGKPQGEAATEGGGGYGAGPEPAYGFQAGVNRPGHGGSHYGSGKVPGTDYDSRYERKDESEQPGYGSEYGRRPESEYGSGYRRKPEVEQPETGYGRKTEYDTTGTVYQSRHGRRTEYQAPESEFGSGYGGRAEYKVSGSEYQVGSGYSQKANYGEEQEGGREHGYGGRTGGPQYQTSGYGRNEFEKTRYEDEPPRKPTYDRQSYERQDGEDYGRPSYGRSEEEHYRKPSYERRKDKDDDSDYGEKGYAHKKYGSNSDDDDDDEEKKRNRHKHRHRKNYDEE